MNKFDQQLEEIFAQNQEVLDGNDRAARNRLCMDKSPDDFVCTKEWGHVGEHMAHGRLGTVISRWEQ